MKIKRKLHNEAFPESIKELIGMFKYPIASYWLNNSEMTGFSCKRFKISLD